MKPKTLVLLAVAGGCGLVAMLGVQQAMQGQQAPVKIQTAKVLVALENIEAGMRLTPDNATFQQMPVDSLPADPIRSEEEYAERAAKYQLLAGEVVRQAKLTNKGEYGKSVAIPKGMRVQTIPVDDTHTSSGLLQPGDRVDVHVTYQARGVSGGAVSKTKTLLEYVEVFAADDHTANKMSDKPGSSKAKTVSLLLTPEQVNFVLLAQQKGTLSLSWRNRSDDELAQTKDIDEKLLEELAGTVGVHDEMSLDDRPAPYLHENLQTNDASQFLDNLSSGTPAVAPAVAASPPAPLWTVEIYSGNDATAHQFELNTTKTTTTTTTKDGNNGAATAPGDLPPVALPEEVNTPEKMEAKLNGVIDALGR
jgi:pilus assembly protein CpaB